MGDSLDSKDGVEDRDEIVDLDALTTKKVTFVFKGKTHVLLPITTRVFAEFWNQVLSLKNNKLESVSEQNQAYLKTIQTLCKTITIKEVEQMTLMQKSTLLEAMTAKVVGDRRIFDASKTQGQKKNLNSDSASSS